MDIFQENYRKLLQILPELWRMKHAVKLTALGCTAINVNIVDQHDKKLVIRISHFLDRFSGDPIPDPDVTIAVYLRTKTAEVLTYQDCFGFRQVYRDDLMAFSPLAKRDLNHLLDQWLSKLIEQGRTPCSVNDAKSDC